MRIKKSSCVWAHLFITLLVLGGCGGGGGGTGTTSTTTTTSTTATSTATTAGGGGSQNAGNTSASNTVLGKYLLAFHVRDLSVSTSSSVNTNCKVYMAYSDDGASWSPLPNFTPYQGSAPDVIRRGNKLYIYTPDPDYVKRYDLTTGTIDGSSVVIKQADGTNDDYGDITPYLEPSTNKIVLFYKSTKGITGDPQLYDNLPERSATEVDGSDGSIFLKDDGDRIAGGRISDVDIFYDGSKYIMYVGDNPRGPGETPKVSVYTSTTLRGTYTLLPTLASGVLTESGSVPQGYYDADTGKYWTYITVLNPNGAATIKRAVHSDFSRKLTDSDFTLIISNSLFPGLKSTDSPESPGFAVNK